MSLALKLDADVSISEDLHTHLLQTHMSDAAFDQLCGWHPGVCRVILDRTREPGCLELLEICLRIRHSPVAYVHAIDRVAGDAKVRENGRKCTVQDPCCARRLESLHEKQGCWDFNCPTDCMCHH